MEWSSAPQLIVALIVSSYWFCVFAMVVRSWARFGVSSGSLPKTRTEKRMWLLWAPTIVAWIALAWNSENIIGKTVGDSGFLYQAWFTIVWVAAITAVAAFLFTTRCWMSMGSNWSMAVNPNKETELITEGPFSRVRHPIYALSLMLMISSLVVITSWAMLIVAAIHCSMLVLKSWNEEQYLTQLHGQQYQDYLKRTNRFVPLRAA